MGDSLITVVVIMLAAVLMFVFPMMAVSERSDDISQLTVQTATTEFVDNIRATGKITIEDYDKFIQTINAGGNTYEVEMEAKILDENVGIKVTQEEKDKIGENDYYSMYTTQIMESLNSSQGRLKLKEGDMVLVSVKNTNVTISQLLRNFFYRIAGDDSYQIAAKHAGIVQVTGK